MSGSPTLTPSGATWLRAGASEHLGVIEQSHCFSAPPFPYWHCPANAFPQVAIVQRTPDTASFAPATSLSGLLSPPPAYLNPIILGSSIFTVKLCDPGQISTLSELVSSSVKQMVEGVIYAHGRRIK